MRQAIVTKYLGPTNTLGARIKAKCQAGVAVFPADQGDEASHRAAAEKLACRLGWVDSDHYLEGGYLPGADCVWIVVQR